MKHVAPGAFGRRGREESESQHVSKQFRDEFAACRPSAIAVKRRAQVQLRPGIQQEIARPAVETSTAACGRQPGQVADAADVDDDAVVLRGGGIMRRGKPAPAARLARLRQYRGCGNQHITVMPVSSASNAGIADLDGEAEVGAVADGLAVAADCIKWPARNAGFFQQCLNGTRIA